MLRIRPPCRQHYQADNRGAGDAGAWLPRLSGNSRRGRISLLPPSARSDHAVCHCAGEADRKGDRVAVDSRAVAGAGPDKYTGCPSMMAPESPDRVLVLFSGGQDSTTCLAWALARYPHVETIGFAYG